MLHLRVLMSRDILWAKSLTVSLFLLGICFAGKAHSADDQATPVSPPESIASFLAPPPEWVGKTGDYSSVLTFADGTPVRTPEEWQKRREEIRNEWHALMGEWPALITKPEIEILETTTRENIQQLKVRFRWTPNELTTGYLLIPEGKGPFPAVITVYYEPESAVGLTDRKNIDFAIQLARRGFVALSLGTAEASKAQTFSLYYPSLNDAKVQPLSMLAYAAANAWYVLDSLPEVDSSRIAIMGHSFGGKWAMFASCLFDKFACGVWSDPGIVFEDTRQSINYWEPWYLGYHPKPWRKRGMVTEANPAYGLYLQLRKEGRDLHELHALMAPRPFLVSGGAEDPVNRWEPLNRTIEVYDLLGVKNRVAMTNRPSHSQTPESNEQIYNFLQYFLQQGGMNAK